MLESLHFIRPLWLLALVPLAFLAWSLYRPGGGDNPWRRVVDARLLPLLMTGNGQMASRTAPGLLAAGWIVAALALADPTWERKPQPVYQSTASRVVVLDLSQSMNATDLKPSRLARARYKVEDVLALGAEGQTGLVAYAGDAFTVSPLTRDANTIRSLLNVLEPGIMPAPGSRADLGLLKAGELLRQAGASSGQILLIADGVGHGHAQASESAAAKLRKDGYRVSVVGVGTEDETPLVNAQGRLVRDPGGGIVETRLDRAALQAVARAGGGEYRSITDGGESLGALLNQPGAARALAAPQSGAMTQGWKEQGPLLAVLLLPLAALAFRRKWLLSVVLLVGLVSPPQPAMAASWNDLWQRPDQQSAKALSAGDYARASELAKDARLKASAEYKRGNFQVALENFAHGTGTDADYNRGNALAQLGRYPDAISAYDKAIAEDPRNDDARANRAAVEALMKQQQQQQQQGRQQQGQQQQASNSQGISSGKDQGQSQDSSPKDGKRGSSSASSGKGEQQAGANKQEGGNDQKQQAASGKEQLQPGNTFADAAQKLADQQAKASKADEGSPAEEKPGSGAADRLQTARNERPSAAKGPAADARPLDTEEKMAAEQWLRRIPDDPGGLLRRKFLYQYRQRGQHADTQDE